MSAPAPTRDDLLARMLAKIEEMRRALDAGVDGARAREVLDDLERRVRAMREETV